MLVFMNGSSCEHACMHGNMLKLGLILYGYYVLYYNSGQDWATWRQQGRHRTGTTGGN